VSRAFLVVSSPPGRTFSGQQQPQRPGQQMPPPPQYGQMGQYPGGYMPPGGLPGQGGKLVEQESPTAVVREALGGAWQGLLGWSSKAKEAAVKAKDVVATSAAKPGKPYLKPVQVSKKNFK